MNNSNTPLFAALSAASNKAMPKSNTKAYYLLLWLIDGKKHGRNKLILDPLLGVSLLMNLHSKNEPLRINPKQLNF
jgi:hypothetical protein